MDKRVHAFPLGISPKVNTIAQLEFELAYSDVEIHHVSYYSTWTSPKFYRAVEESFDLC